MNRERKRERDDGEGEMVQLFHQFGAKSCLTGGLDC